MAKRDRNRNLAGLAALGALGYHLARQGKQDGSNVPVEDRRPGNRITAANTGLASMGLPPRYDIMAGEADVDPDLAREIARAGRGPVASLEGRRRPVAPAAPARVSAADIEAGRADYKNPQRGPGFGEVEAYERSRVRPAVSAQDEGILGGTALAPGQRNLFARDNRPDLSTAEGRAAAEQAQAVEGVYPETMYGGTGLKALHAAAKRLAAPRVAEYSQPLLAAPTKRLTGPSKADLVARDRAARAAGRQEEMLQENAARYGLDPRAPGYEGAARAVREKLGGDEFILRKKGGMVKAKTKPKKMASGGSTASASKRGDGVAQRGKTKCKMY